MPPPPSPPGGPTPPQPLNKGGPGPRRGAGAAAPRGDPPLSSRLPSRGRCRQPRTASSLRGCPPFPGGGRVPPGGRGVSQAALPGCATLTHSRAARRLRAAAAPAPLCSAPRTRPPRLPPRQRRGGGRSSSRRGRRRRPRRHHG